MEGGGYTTALHCPNANEAEYEYNEPDANPVYCTATSFQKELTDLINKHCLENESNSPDFILAEYLLDALAAFNSATKKRDKWYVVCGISKDRT